ncbi:MAG: hypothetical protein LBL21_04015 [Rickettsiales bacterium]|nr:hypothetical protein [Rickettsiales bacterium]
MKKAVAVVLFAIFLPFQSRAFLLCERWAGYAGGWIGSPTSGWGHVYNWWGNIVAVPTCGYFVVTTATYDGDNDGSWFRPHVVTDIIYMPQGYQVGIYGTVKQACSNNYGEFYVGASLVLMRPDGTAILSSQRIFYNGNPDKCCGSSVKCGGSKCMCHSSTSEDIDRAFSAISVRPATSTDLNTYTTLWSQATVNAVK